MTGHPGLGDDINTIVQRGNDPGASLTLATLTPGNILTITVELDGGESTISFRVLKPPLDRRGIEGVDGEILEASVHEHLARTLELVGVQGPIVGLPVRIQGACTYNQSAAFGMSNYQARVLTIGRNFVGSIKNLEDAIVFPCTVLSWAVSALKSD